MNGNFKLLAKGEKVVSKNAVAMETADNQIKH